MFSAPDQLPPKRGLHAAPTSGDATADPATQPPDHPYSVRTVLMIWAAATVPMASLAWIGWPLLTRGTDMNPGMLFWLLMVAGMIWQFVLAFNDALFTAYHLRKPWALPVVFLTSLPFGWAARRYRTTWFAIVLHSLEGVVLLVLVSGVVSGIAFR